MPLFRALPDGAVETKSGPDDLVTVADRAAEAAITCGVAALLPDAAVVGEEAASIDPGILSRIGAPGMCVIVDPVDGTGNYARGLATFGMILAVTIDGQTAFGLLYDPVLDDWVMATRGGGAWFCRPDAPPRRLTLGPAPPLGQAQGFLSVGLFPAPLHPALHALRPAEGRMDDLHCSCHEYRQIALGHSDFIASGALKPWDHAAGVLVVAEAGGRSLLSGGRAYAPTVHSGSIVVGADAATAVAMRDALDAVLATSEPAI
jgi:fructose-1,6-bisphosphatase/inositol monophosphatase family enzyme